MKTRSVAVYMRVSTDKQTHKSQKADLEKYIKVYLEDTKVKWYVDKHSGKGMDGPEWKKLESKIQKGRVETLLVWKIDRLGRTALGLHKLFKVLQDHETNLVSMTEKFDLETPNGRLVANIMTGVAQYEGEVNSERIKSGQAAARAEGKKWGGSKKGRLTYRISVEQVKAVIAMKAKGNKISTIQER